MHLLLADENFDLEVSERLRDFGHDVITLQNLGLAEIKYPDEKVLEKAKELGRCILTQIIHGLIYYETKLPTIPGHPRHSVLIVSEDTIPRLIPAGAQAWQPFWLLTTTNP